MLDRTVAPAYKDAVDYEFTLPACEHWRLDNNLPVYAYRGGSQEVVQIEWVFGAGIWDEQQTAVAQAVATLIKNGTQHKTSLEINEAIEFYGASLRVIANNDYATITLQCLTKHLSKVLPIVHEIITTPAFPEEELQIFKQNALQRLKVNLMRCDFVANRNIDALVFGRQHPYGKYTEAEDVNALTTAALKAFHEKNYQAKNCHVFIAGLYSDLDLELFNNYFGQKGWGSGTLITTHQTIALDPAPIEKLRIVNDELGVQGAVRIASNFPNRHDPLFPSLFMMNTLYGGYFGSRLMANIREEKGYTYGIYAQIYAYKHAASLLIATEAGKEVCEATVDEVFKEMDILRNQVPDEDEVALVKNYILGNLLGDLDGPFSIMLRWKTLVLNNMNIQHFNNNIKVYKEITGEEIQTLAQQYLKPELFYNLVVI